MPHLAHQRPPAPFTLSLFFLVADPAVCRPATAATSKKGVRNLAQNNGGIGEQCPRAGDGDGDARTKILRALAGPPPASFAADGDAPGQQQNRHPSENQSPSMKPPAGWYNQVFLSFFVNKPWGGKDPVPVQI